MENSNEMILKILIILSLTCTHVLATRTNFVRGSNSLKLPLVFPNSPDSPLYIKNLTRKQRIERSVRDTINRANCIYNFKQPQRLPQQELCVKGTNVLLKIGIGTFQAPVTYKTYFLNVDTGSEQIWLQCEDCLYPPNKCFGHPPNFFTNTESSTYHQIPCATHELCYTAGCKDGVCSYECTNGLCSYHSQYLDDSYITGYLAFERFIFGISPRQKDITQDNVFNLVFGCNLFFQGVELKKGAIGILGLGWGPRSFISQIKTQVGNSFSYCYPHEQQTHFGTQGFLKLGLDDEFDPNEYSAIALRRYGNQEAYYLNLYGISVAGTKLNIDPSVFRKVTDNDGTVIDSGSSISLLVPEACEELKKQLIAHFESTGDYQRVIMPSGFWLDLCYESTEHIMIDELPNVTLLFDGADLLLKPPNVFILIEDRPDTFCLAIIRSVERFTVLGAFQQSNFHFVYDRRNMLLHYKHEDCHFDG